MEPEDHVHAVVVEAAAVHSAGGPSHKSSAVGRFGAWETRPWPCQLPFRVEHLNIPHLKWTRHRCRRDHPEHGNPGVKLNHFPFSRPILVPSWSVLHRQWLNRGHPVGFFVTCNESWTKVGATWQRPVGGRDKDSRHDKKVQQRRCPVTATEPSEQDRQHGDTKTWATAAAAEDREKHLRAVRHLVCVLHRERERAPNACCSVRRKLLSFCHWPPSKLTAACACGLVVHGNSCRCQEIIDWSMKQNLNIYPTVHLKPIPFAKLSWLCMMSKSHFPVSIRESAPISFDGFLLKERRGFHKIWRIWQNQLAEYLLRPCSYILPL